MAKLIGRGIEPFIVNLKKTQQDEIRKVMPE
jgi:hypothetical protein